MASNLTAREQQVLIAVVKVAVIDSKAIDWSKVAAEADFNTAKQARDKFATVRAKLLAATASPVANGEAAEANKGKKRGPGAASAAAASGRIDHGGRVGKKRKSESEGDDEDDQESVDEDMPKKKARMAGKAGKKKVPVTPDPQLDGEKEEWELPQGIIKKESAVEEGDCEGEWDEV